MAAEYLLSYALAVIVTLLVVRGSLVFFPKTDVYIGRYNVHHLYTGALFLILLLPFLLAGVINLLTSVLAGIFSALIVDQLVCLIVGDCNERTYPSWRSFTGMIFFAGLLLLTVALVFYLFGR